MCLSWEEVIEFKVKCPYWRKQIPPRGQLHHFIWQRCSMLSRDVNQSKLRGNHSNLTTPPPQFFVPLLWCMLIQNRTKQWDLEQISRGGGGSAQNNAPLTRGKSLKICVPLCWGVFPERLFFFFSLFSPPPFGPYWDSQERYELTRHFNYNWW